MASTSNLFELRQIEMENTNIDAGLIFQEIHKEIRDYLAGKGNDTDSTGGVFNFLEYLTNRLQEDFEELIGEYSNKKRFVKALTRIFVLLLNTRVDMADKIKRILRIAVETTLEIWQGPK